MHVRLPFNFHGKDGREFLARYENPSEAINIQFNSEANRIMKNNQQVIESLFKIVGSRDWLCVVTGMTVLIG